jgi:hypothetical protein
MLDTSDEFEFMFEKVIFTDLLLGDHKNNLTVSRNQGLFDKEFTAKLMGLKKQFEQSMVFEPSEFELAKFHFI